MGDVNNFCLLQGSIPTVKGYLLTPQSTGRDCVLQNQSLKELRVDCCVCSPVMINNTPHKVHLKSGTGRSREPSVVCVGLCLCTRIRIHLCAHKHSPTRVIVLTFIHACQRDITTTFLGRHVELLYHGKTKMQSRS